MTDQQGAREADRRSSSGIQQQTGWNRFFDHGLDDLISDTGANGGGCLVVYDRDERVKKFDAEREKRWGRSYETGLNDLLPVSEANSGGYLVALDHELVRLGRDGSTQWRRSYGVDESASRSIRSVTETGSGGFLFVGETWMSEPYPGRDVSWAAKTSGNGTVTWQLEKSFFDEGETATNVYGMEDGGYLIGVIRHNLQVGLVKIDETGAVDWKLEFGETATIHVTDEDSILVTVWTDSRLIRVTADGAIQWTKEYNTKPPYRILEDEDGFIVARGQDEYILEMLRDDGTRRWGRSYDRPYTVAHGEPDGPVLFGTDTVMKINPDGTTEWERPLYVPTAIEYLYNLEDGGYLLGGGRGPSWIALRESLAGGVAVLPDVDGDGNPTQDPDGDGRYEDVNGDGSVNVGDAQALYNNRESTAIQINGELYDFNNDGAVNVGDAQALFAEVTDDN